MIPLFYGKKQAGRLNLFNRGQLEDYIQSFPEDSSLTLIVVETFRQRTLTQNAYYHGVVLQCISDYTGHTTEELHEYFKWRILSKEGALPEASTTDLSTTEFTAYIDLIVYFAWDFLEIVIPPPERVEFRYHGRALERAYLPE